MADHIVYKYDNIKNETRYIAIYDKNLTSDELSNLFVFIS